MDFPGWAPQQALRAAAAVLDEEGYPVTAVGADGASLTTVWHELPSVFVQRATRTRLTVRAAAEADGTRLEIQAETQRNEGEYDPLLPENVEWKFLERDEELEQSILERLRARLQTPAAPRLPGESRPELRPR